MNIETAKVYDLPMLTRWVGQVEGHLSALAEHVLRIDQRTENQYLEQKQERQAFLEAVAHTRMKDVFLMVLVSSLTSTGTTLGVLWLVGSVKGWF